MQSSCHGRYERRPHKCKYAQGIGAKGDIDEVGIDDMYNPWYNILTKEGKGTLSYQGSWNLFDQIILTPNLLEQKGTKKISRH